MFLNDSTKLGIKTTCCLESWGSPLDPTGVSARSPVHTYDGVIT